jgi:hypothetical protein
MDEGFKRIYSQLKVGGIKRLVKAAVWEVLS